MNMAATGIGDALEEWANEREQRRLWLSDGADGADVSSFAEAREALFTDTGLSEALAKDCSGYDADVVASLLRLDELLSRIDGNQAPEEVIADPRMRDVRQLASHILAALPRSNAD